MAHIGRNDSCPCGSGKKYKHCCLNRSTPKAQPPSVPGLYTKEDRASALHQLLKFSGRPEFEEDRLIASPIYRGKASTGKTDEARAAREGRTPYDFGWLWQELGLPRKS
jgi:hypothetical protein